MSGANVEPRYREIADHLRHLVADGQPGDLLPSDSELCERFGVSRMTARNAMQMLVTEGLVYRRRGQGTFVAARPVPRLLGSPLSFTESMRRRGLAAGSRVLSAALVAASADESKALEQEPGGQVVVVERLRLADGTPMAIERAVLAPELALVLEHDLDRDSLHEAMGRGGYPPVTARAHVSARLATPKERRLLSMSRVGVVLCERRVILNPEGRPIEYTKTRYAAERYAFELVEHRNGS